MIRYMKVIILIGIFISTLTSCSIFENLPIIGSKTSLSSNFNAVKNKHASDLKINIAHSKKIFLMPYKNGKYILSPGLYEAKVRSFCLKPGTHSPSSGDGYLHSKLQGTRSKLIQNILKSYSLKQNSNVSQKKVQSLIWAIIAGTPYANMNQELKTTFTKLAIDNSELISSVGTSFLLEKIQSKMFMKIKPEVKKLIDLNNKIKEITSSSSLSYESLEKIAILAGAAPVDHPEYKRGDWSKTDDKFYIRFLPNGYSSMYYQVYVPETAGTVNFDVTNSVALPANTGAQRIGMTNPVPQNTPEEDKCPGVGSPSIQNSKKDSAFKKAYAKCSRDIINHVKDNISGVNRIGGRVLRCIRNAPGKTRKETYTDTDGTCKDGKTSYGKSSHANGHGVDYFVNDTSEPSGCEKTAGDDLATWAVDNASEYGIKNVIWNKKIYSEGNGWTGKPYGGKNHYDHVHIECK